jgi:tetratricopeptide (TPR) repeat protein/predicted aspartyl protease
VRTRHVGSMAALAAFSLWTVAASARCQLQQIGVLQVDMQDLRPLVWAKINGAKARFLLDSGSFYNSISRAAAEQYRLPLESIANDTAYVTGVGGSETVKMTTVDNFDFLGIPLHKIPFLVFDQGAGTEVAGLIGQNALRGISDVEYDLADGIVRFLKPVGCESQALAYWAVKTPYSYVELESMNTLEPHLRSEVTINGQRMTVWFDTGSSRSMLSLEAAKRAGITPNSPGVTFLGIGGGIGPAPAKMWVAPVDSFQIGGEKVEHTHLMVADFQPRDAEGFVSRGFPDMMLGDDFFLSHRIYVAYSQNKLYFTYNGGPLFNLNLPQFTAGGGAAPPGPGASAPASAPAGAQATANEPTDAAGFRRRGMALAAMREFDRALADLTRACELAPGDAENRYQRGVIYQQRGELKSALQDFDAALKAQPDDIDAHLARAELLHWNPGTDPASAATQVKSDLDAVSRLAPPDAGVRLTLSSLYGEVGEYPAALDQVNQWLGTHHIESERAEGLNERCWLRAMANQDLTEALDDCNQALALTPSAQAEMGTFIGRTLAPRNPAILDSRGLVYLRLGRLKDAVGDYDSALKTDPNMPTSLYGRGLAELRQGEKTNGQVDIAAAEKLDSGVTQLFAAMGLTP